MVFSKLRAVRLAWISSVRQPARTGLGILGIAAVGALLFDMLLLSRGLVISFRDVLDRSGFDVRILATDSPVLAGPHIAAADQLVAQIARLPQVEAVVPVSFGEAEVVDTTATRPDGAQNVRFIGTDPRAAPLWTLLEGGDLEAVADTSVPLIINPTIASTYRLTPGSTITLRSRCGEETAALPPLSFTVAGIGEFALDDAESATVAGRLTDLDALCARNNAGVDMVLVRSLANDGGDAAAAAIRATAPDVFVITNRELVEQFSRVQFSYFRQISFVLASVTIFFGFLLIAVLLTASVNQRLAEIAALRALGLSRARVVAGVLSESAIMVGIGAVLAVPAGLALSMWLDGILRRLPGIPSDVHFFVFEPRVLGWYTALLVASAVGAALYPIWIVARLPVAATLRREVVG
jgi:putative ABC transport system permease protein